MARQQNARQPLGCLIRFWLYKKLLHDKLSNKLHVTKTLEELTHFCATIQPLQRTNIYTPTQTLNPFQSTYTLWLRSHQQVKGIDMIEEFFLPPLLQVWNHFLGSIFSKVHRLNIEPHTSAILSLSGDLTQGLVRHIKCQYAPRTILRVPYGTSRILQFSTI